MKNTILILAALLIFPSCKENNNTKTQKMSNLTSENYVETMINVIKHYNYEPMYYLTYVQNVCFSEILVNDIPVNKNFQEIGDGGTLSINRYIFKSGIQKVTFRLYPAGKNKDFDFPTLVDDTDMKIEITESDNNKRKIDGKTVANYVTPLTVKKYTTGYEATKFEGSGRTYYEASFTFNAIVPYEFNSLDKGQDLRKLNPEALEKKVVAFYKNQWNLINQKKVDNYFSYLELKEKESSISMYYNRVELEEILKSYLEAFTIPNYKLQPLENYKLKFYGDGKIACLEIVSLDNKLKGESALWAKFDEGDGMMADFLKYYLYIPEGKTELEILR